MADLPVTCAARADHPMALPALAIKDTTTPAAAGATRADLPAAAPRAPGTPPLPFHQPGRAPRSVARSCRQGRRPTPSRNLFGPPS